MLETHEIIREEVTEDRGTVRTPMGTTPTYAAGMQSAAMLARCGREHETFVVRNPATGNEWAFQVRVVPAPAVPARITIQAKVSR